jgi:uncharacterized protein (TIGR00299 family) protein
MKIAHLDCFSGLSGDMFLGALLDAGLPPEALKERLGTLPLGGYRLTVQKESRHEISGTRLLVETGEAAQPARNLEAIGEIVEKGDLSPWVKERAMEVFSLLAHAEAEVHNRPPQEIHFHEVGAVDSIIDIVGTVYAVEALGITRLSASALPLGSGLAETAHGSVPIPAPATLALLRGVSVYDSGLPFEMVTPTGAALVKTLAHAFGPMPPMVIRRAAHGVGSRDLPDRPNLLRILLGEAPGERDGDTVVILETNVDDATPEWLGFLMDRLLEAGALDVVFCPVQMKKNRPAVQVQVMGRPDRKETLMEILFKESPTLGVRFHYSQRSLLKRASSEVESPWGKIRVKEVPGVGGEPLFIPEYEACREIAIRENRPLREIISWVLGLNRET